MNVESEESTLIGTLMKRLKPKEEQINRLEHLDGKVGNESVLSALTELSEYCIEVVARGLRCQTLYRRTLISRELFHRYQNMCSADKKDIG